MKRKHVPSGLPYLSHVSTVLRRTYWMSANFLSLNPSQTEFLIFGLPQQLSKLNKPTIQLHNNVIFLPVNSTHNLGAIFDKNLSFAHHTSAFLHHAFTIFVT